MSQISKDQVPLRKPEWLKRSLPKGPEFESIRGLIKKDRLHTVCKEAMCPNIWECFAKKTATFLLMGPGCTRSCGFCAVEHGPTDRPDPDEPLLVAEAAKEMGLSYVVVTSVTRDDLPDGGAAHFAKTVSEIKKKIPGVKIEILIPDFKGDVKALETVLQAGPDVINHNIETCRELYDQVRPEADYDRSLGLLKHVRKLDATIPTKSGMMLGLGETPVQISRSFEDLFEAQCSILTIGQYLSPSKDHLPVKRYVPPEEFESWRKKALGMGLLEVSSGPFIRSSYHADKIYENTGEIK